MMRPSKCLIACFSRNGMNYVGGTIRNLVKGNTKVAAEKIVALTGATLYDVMPETPYPKEYDACTRRTKEDMKNGARPLLLGSLPDPGAFQTLVLGYPNFWGTMPMPVWTFLESLNLSGKVVLPFCTHEGSGMGVSERDIRLLCPKSTVRAGLAISGVNVKQSDALISAWLKENGII